MGRSGKCDTASLQEIAGPKNQGCTEHNLCMQTKRKGQGIPGSVKGIWLVGGPWHGIFQTVQHMSLDQLQMTT